ncbi:MAG: hypothetical protein U9R37_01990 [Campylobacterota bacterium]|nr:hypothetical protein [Campylobacterota bacterium]
MKNIFLLSISLLGIMLLSTLIVVGFNLLIGYSTDVNNNDVATSIAAVAFMIAVILKYLFNKTDKQSP